MPRPRKSLKFEEMLDPMSIADLQVLKNEVAVVIRLKTREEIRVKNENESRKIRDKIKIGSIVHFQNSGSSKALVKAEVTGIFSDKVQVLAAGRQKTIALTRVKSVE